MGGGRQVIAWMLEPLRCPPAVMQLGHRRPDVDQGVFIQTSVRSSPATRALATGGARSLNVKVAKSGATPGGVARSSHTPVDVLTSPEVVRLS